MNNQFCLNQFNLIKDLIDEKVSLFNSEIDKQELLDSFEFAKNVDIDKFINGIYEDSYKGEF